MDYKKIGYFCILIGSLIIILMLMVKLREDYYINLIVMEQGGSCYLEDGTCLHEDRAFLNYIFGSVLSIALIILGLFMVFSKKTESAEKDIPKKDYAKAAEKLEPDEKNIYNEIVVSGGTIFTFMDFVYEVRTVRINFFP